MKSSELVRVAKQYGWALAEQDGTSHRAYEKNGKRVIIPFHGSKEVPTGTCSKILKIIKGVE
jgi:predicted RNA binding protein YcfA (HicA-like mRNA interferase family)